MKHRSELRGGAWQQKKSAGAIYAPAMRVQRNKLVRHLRLRCGAGAGELDDDRAFDQNACPSNGTGKNPQGSPLAPFSWRKGSKLFHSTRPGAKAAKPRPPTRQALGGGVGADLGAAVVELLAEVSG
jgi:hypothetical protein